MTPQDRLSSEELRTARLQMLRRLLSRLLISSGVLLAGTLTAMALALILQSAGDDAGAASVRGLAWLALACLMISLLALLSALTIAVAHLMDQAADSAGLVRSRQSQAEEERPADAVSD